MVRSRATENTPLIDWKRCLELPVVLILSHLVRSIRTICTIRTIQDSLPKFLRVVGARFAILDFFVLFAVCKVAIHLVHVNTGLVHFEKVDQL